MNKPTTFTLSAHVLGQTITQTFTEDDLRKAYAEALSIYK